ncbi:hypothetical protein PAXINDRAFT_15970 [Paxillus involutus ATCC 200175]|uniref:Uncharacterized protein n=1 Tax=Paxillus involutus ATCC 200175 TaxID=664439 RepID=A0A0C9TK47_PAXIN|nr:hypothetical protein PAXINDRAFT_15970 [Paxillus involutus ATCC 200175]
MNTNKVASERLMTLLVTEKVSESIVTGLHLKQPRYGGPYFELQGSEPRAILLSIPDEMIHMGFFAGPAFYHLSERLLSQLDYTEVILRLVEQYSAFTAFDISLAEIFMRDVLREVV